MPYEQAPPTLGNQYEDDRALRSLLRRALPADVHRDVAPSLREMGRLAGGPLYALQQADRLHEPELTRWDAWGNHVDVVAMTPLWQEAERLAAEHGVVATAYERRHGHYSRLHQFALAYLFHPSTDVYACPLAMTDGAAQTLLAAGNRALIDRAVPRLTSRDPGAFWTSGQWMTELTGGSDVGRSETVARRDDGGTWRLYGRKWFTSAVASPMALTLARPEGNPGGGRGLALFYVEARDADGRPNRMEVLRLKDKLGTRKLPTAELRLDGTPASPVTELAHGTRHIAPMLNVTRTWNAVTAAAAMRRGLALAADYARRRSAFGAPLVRQPLHVDTLAGLQAEAEAALHLTFWVVELLGRADAGDDDDEALLRLLTPLAKLTTGKQAVAVASEVLEAFGGAGYVEDTGLPALLRDAQVLPIWEGTTNVLALDVLRVLDALDGPSPLVEAVETMVERAGDAAPRAAVDAVRGALASVGRWLEATRDDEARRLSGARRLALTLGRTAALARLLDHAAWAVRAEDDPRPAAAARRFAAHGIDRLADAAPVDSRLLLDGLLP